MITFTLRPGALRPSQLSGQSLGGAAPKPSDQIYSLGRPGACPTHPTLLIAIFDDSGSVTAPLGGNDPVGNRYREAAAAIRRVGSGCRCRRELVAVLHFDTPTDRDVAPTSIRGPGHQQVATGLQLPGNAVGSSCLGPSLQAATLLAGRHPGHTATLVVFSDLALLDPDPVAVLDQLADFPGAVHAVVLGGRRPRSLHERITSTEVRYNDPPGAVARALFGDLTRHRKGVRQPIQRPGDASR